ncbi:MAG: hypothetical protein JWR63_853 [Conexibacter sp.]|nr:hypothetical protein [Conexibacter sp.]
MSNRSRRRTLAGIVFAVAAVGLLATLALAQDVVPIKITTRVKVTPNKAGTPKHPQGVKAEVWGTIDIPHDVDPPLVQSVDVWFPKDGIYNGTKFPTCSGAKMAHSGPSICPARSVMGHGTAVADADGVKTRPTVTVLNGGRDKVWFYVVLQHPARVAEPVRGTITKLIGSRWGYKVHVDIPRNLQIVAGIPLRVDSFHGIVGRGDWIATTHCPSDHRWRYHAEAHYSSGQIANVDGTVVCRS